MTLDPATGHVYVAEAQTTLREYDGASLVSVTPYTAPGSSRGIAVDGVTGRVYLGFGTLVKVYGPTVTIPDVTTGPPLITGDTSATLSGQVDPDGVVLNECYFEYGLTDSYGQTVPCKESVGDIGTTAKEVHADISGLAGETLYHYRLVAKNLNDTVEGADRVVKSPSKPAIKGHWAMNVSLNSATLKATINPENSPTTYHFEWGTDSSYGKSSAETEAGSDDTDHTVSVQLEGLDSGAVTHYRVVATNGLGIVQSSDHTVKAFALPLESAKCSNEDFRIGLSAHLPDCRAFEMVSPLAKNGGDVRVLGSNNGFPARLDQSSISGDIFTYSSGSSFSGAASRTLASQYLATRVETSDVLKGGWSTQAISPPRESTSLSNTPAFKFDVQFKAFSPDLRTGWLLHDTNPQFDACAVEGYPNLYQHHGSTGTYRPLTIAKPLNASPSQYGLELQGLSVGGRHSVFRANAKLTTGAAGAFDPDRYQLYEHVAEEGDVCGELRLVSVLANNKASTGSSSLGSFGGNLSGESRENSVARAVSADGSRIFWSTTGPGASLNVRIEGKETVQISGDPNAQFRSASVDGSIVIYTVGKELYEFDVGDKSLP